MNTLSWWTEWPAGPIRVGVVFLVAVTAVAAALRLPGVILDLGDEASRNDALSYVDREIAGGNAVVEDQHAVYQARARIPPGDAYHVAVGEGFEAESPLTIPYVSSYYRYFLLPRREAEVAPWVICYGCNTDAYPDGETVWSSGTGISIIRRSP